MSAAAGGGGAARSSSDDKLLWLSTRSQDALTAGLEAGVSTVVFTEQQAPLAKEWQQLGRFEALTQKDGLLVDAAGQQVRVCCRSPPLLLVAHPLQACRCMGAPGSACRACDAAELAPLPAPTLLRPCRWAGCCG